VKIVFHAHHAEMPEPLQERAEQAVQKLASRLKRAVDASVRFAEDGQVRRVEIVLRAPRQQPLVAAGSGRLYETALGEALERLESHIAHLKAAKGRRIRFARAVSRTGDLERLLAARALAQADGDDTEPEALKA
jgi:ribosome-associated translation inhibitor RaiA